MEASTGALITIFALEGGVILPYRLGSADERMRLETFIRAELISIDEQVDHKFHWVVDSYPLSAGGFGLRVHLSPHHLCKPDCRTDDHNPKTGQSWGDALTQPPQQ